MSGSMEGAVEFIATPGKTPSWLASIFGTAKRIRKTVPAMESDLAAICGKDGRLG
jgi:hypothetical protein